MTPQNPNPPTGRPMAPGGFQVPRIPIGPVIGGGTAGVVGAVVGGVVVGGVIGVYGADVLNDLGYGDWIGDQYDPKPDPPTLAPVQPGPAEWDEPGGTAPEIGDPEVQPEGDPAPETEPLPDPAGPAPESPFGPDFEVPSDAAGPDDAGELDDIFTTYPDFTDPSAPGTGGVLDDVIRDLPTEPGGEAPDITAGKDRPMPDIAKPPSEEPEPEPDKGYDVEDQRPTTDDQGNTVDPDEGPRDFPVDGGPLTAGQLDGAIGGAEQADELGDPADWTFEGFDYETGATSEFGDPGEDTKLGGQYKTPNGTVVDVHWTEDKDGIVKVGPKIKDVFYP